jgi:ribose transport system permease protein
MSSVSDRTMPEAPVAPEEPGRPRRWRRKPVRAYLEAYAFLGLLVLAFLFFSFWSKTSGTFTTSANLQVLVGSSTVVAIVALGALIPLVCNEWDLSIGASAALAGVYAAQALVHGTAVPLAILLAVGIGLVVGVVNALLVTRLAVNAVITTLGVSIIVAGVVSLKTHGNTITGNIPSSLTNFGTLNWFGVPRSAFALAAVALLVYYGLNHTPWGRYLYALGSNRSAARLAGIRVKLLIGSTFVIAGAICGAGGILQVAQSGSADPNLANTLLLPALAAAFLSAAAIRPGRYNVGGVLVAVYFLAVLNSGLNLAGAANYVSDFVNGAALIVGVGLSVRLGQRREP